MIELPIYKYKQVIGYVKLDDEDAQKLSGYNIWTSSYGYPRFRLNGKDIDIHRFVLGLNIGDKKIVDHINGNIFDSQKQNLRLVSKQQNAQNRTNTSDVGLIYYKNINKWGGRATYKGKCIYTPVFDKQEDARKANNQLRKDLGFTSTDPKSHLVVKTDEEIKKIFAKYQFKRNINKPQSGIKNISWHVKHQRWQIRITINGKLLYLGSYKDLNEAKNSLEQYYAKRNLNNAITH